MEPIKLREKKKLNKILVDFGDELEVAWVEDSPFIFPRTAPYKKALEKLEQLLAEQRKVALRDLLKVSEISEASAIAIFEGDRSKFLKLNKTFDKIISKYKPNNEK